MRWKIMLNHKMGKTNLVMLLLVMLVAFVLAGCTYPGVNPPNPPLNCNTGTQGFSASFESGSVRSNYDTGVVMPLIVDLTNNGASDAQAIVRVGYIHDLLQVSSSDLSSCSGSSCSPAQIKVNLTGKSSYNSCQGTGTTAAFYIRPYTLPLVSQSFKTDISLDVCYHYWTNLSNQQVCVNPDIGGLNALKPNCQPADISIGGGQGSPVSITKVEAPIYHNSTGKVSLRVYIRNFGGGSIVAYTQPNDLDGACSLQPDVHNNYIFVKGFLDNYNLTCNINNPGTIKDKTYLQYDPQVTTQNNQQQTLKDYYFNCETEQPVTLSGATDMNLNLMIAYYYRDFGVDSQIVNIRKVQ